MKPKYRIRLLALAHTFFFTVAVGSAETLTYDADTGVPGVQDGPGAGWNTTNPNFWNGFQNVNWANTSADDAVFGFGNGQAGTVAVGTVMANRITFNPPGEGNFALAGGTITLGGTTPTIETNDDSSIGSVLAGSAGLAKTGSGTLVLTGANTYSGGTTVNSGVLQLGNASVNGTVGSGAYNLAAGTTLYLNYATATATTTLGWSYQITGAGTLELNSAQALDGSAKWGPNSSTAVPFAPSFTGTLQMDKGRFDSSASGLGGVTRIAIKSGGQFMAWAGGTYTPAFEIAGTGYGESGQSGAIRSTGTTTLSGNVTLTDNAQIMVNSAQTLNLTGSITGPYVCEFYPTSTTGVINVTPAAAVQNSYAGTKVNASATSSNSVVAGNQYAFSTGTLEVVQGILKLNGFNFSFASLSGTGGRIGNYSATTVSNLTVGSGNTSTSYGGSILNGGTAALNMVKTGTGSLTLTGNSTYTGSTTVSGGALLLNATSGLTTSTAISVASGTTFGGKGVGGATTAAAGSTIQGGFNGSGNLALSSLAFGGSSVLNLSPVAGTTASLAVSGALSTSGTQTVNVVNSSPLPAGAYRLASYGSITGAGTGAFVLGTTPPSTGFRPRTYLLDTTPCTYLGLTVTSDTAVWTGGADGNWDAVTPGNWKQLSNGAPTQYYPTDVVQFGDAAGVRNVVLGTVDVSPASVAFVNGAGFDYTLSGIKAITGTAALTKSGSGTVTITNTNSYTGGTTISDGTLQLGNGVANGVITGAITDNANLVFANGVDQTFSGVISGTGAVGKSGTGVLTLSGTNTYTGATNINGGVLAGTGFKANGTACNLGNGTVVNLNGGTLRYTGAAYGGDGTAAKFNRTLNVGVAGGSIDTVATGAFWYDGTFTGSGTLSIICSAFHQQKLAHHRQ